jgi:spindle assembly abnormal protein 6
VLRIHISSEEDAFFLHTLEVSEEEFQALKAEQGILVDFGNFPGKIIGLLERCIASRHEEAPRYEQVQHCMSSTVQANILAQQKGLAARPLQLFLHCCRFQAVLLTKESSSIFRIMETNDFNQLPHVTLAFRPGNDGAIKQFLACRLAEFRLTNARLKHDVEQTKV